MSKTPRLLLAILLLCGAAARPAAADAPVSTAAASMLEHDVRVHRLANGMTFLLLERHAAPIFTGVIRFRTGGLEDPPGRSGLAHLFEHLAFKGTTRIGTRQPDKEAEAWRRVEEAVDRLEAARRHVPPDPEAVRAAQRELESREAEHRRLLVPGEFMEVYVANGAVGLNAATDKDLTSYFVSLPANRVELWCLMESERLRDGVLREFYTERDVVTEERRLRVEASPFGLLYETLLGAAFPGGPYGIPTVGTMEDLGRVRTADALVFRRRHYRPENAVAVLVGDFRTDQVLPLIQRHFGDWHAEPGAAAEDIVDDAAAQTRPATAGASAAGPQTPAPPPRPQHVQVSFPSQPYLLIGFDKPVYPNPDAVKFRVLDELLTGGRSSILYRRLVVEKQLALDLFALEGPGQRLDNLFMIGAVPQAPHTSAEVESGILDELAAMARQPVPARELEKVRNRFQASFIRGLRSNTGLALQLAYYQVLYGDWKQMLRLLERAGEVTAADLQDILRRYLSADRRVTAELVSQPQTAPGAPEPAAGAQTSPAAPQPSAGPEPAAGPQTAPAGAAPPARPEAAP